MRKLCITVVIGILLMIQTAYASDFIISDISDEFTFTVEGETQGQNVGLILTLKDISWEGISNESMVDSEIVYFDEYQVQGSKYSFSFPLGCKSGIYKC